MFCRRAEIEREARKRVALEKQAFEYVKHLSLTDSVTDEELINIVSLSYDFIVFEVVSAIESFDTEL